MGTQPGTGRGLSRRELMKRGMRTGAYAAPLVLASVAVSPAAAQVSGTRCVQPVPFTQDFVITGGPPSFTYNVFYRPNTSMTFTQAPVDLNTDAVGVGGVVFPITTFDTSMVSSVLVVATIPGQPASTPQNPAASFTSNLITVLTCTNGGARPAALLLGFIVQEQTAPAVGGVAPYINYVDVGIFNGAPNTSYDIYILRNGGGTPIPITTMTTNSAGNISAFIPTAASGTAATSFTINAVLAGGPPTAVVLSRVVSGANLVTIPFVPSAVRPATDYHPQGHTIQP